MAPLHPLTVATPVHTIIPNFMTLHNTHLDLCWDVGTRVCLHVLLTPPPHNPCMQFTQSLNNSFDAYMLQLQPRSVRCMIDRSREMAHRLIAAAQSGDITSVRRLVDRGTDVNATDEYGETALHHATER